MNQTVTILPDEYWWGGAVNDGDRFPLCKDSQYVRDFTVNRTYNQLSGTFVSTRGRVLFTDGDYTIAVANGAIRMESASEIVFEDGYGDLKGAVKAAAKHYAREPIMSETAVRAPQYCTWMEMLNQPTQEKVLRYAQSIIDADLPAGVLIIDDGWQRAFGDWRFSEAFPDPKAMIQRLHEFGFTVVLWLVPFVNRSAATLWSENALIHDAFGRCAERRWWNGESYVLDMTAEAAQAELKRQLRALTDLGADGFKFDGGDAMYYCADDVTQKPTTPNGQSALWAEFGEQFDYAELRACVGLQGRGLIQRLCDKGVAWRGGLDVLIPDMIQAGLIGYPYICPDMIGGGQSDDSDKTTDEDWYIRSVQCAVLSPMWQFSRAIWNVSPRVRAAVLDCVRLRKKAMPHILLATEAASKTGEPILRPMCYEFAGQGLETITDQFMLGDGLLVAPIVMPNVHERQVVLPADADWKSVASGKVYAGGQTVTSENLPCFERVER